MTFHDSGGLVENDNGPAGPSVGIGAWTRLGPQEFVAITHKQSWGAGKDENGEPVIRFTGMVEVRQRITLSEDGNQFTSLDELKVFAPDGTLVLEPPPAPSYGTRVVAAAPVVQPQMLAPVVSGSEVTVRFIGRPGVNHQLQHSVRVDGGWATLAEVVVPTNGVARFTDPAPPQPNGLYRVALPPDANPEE